MFLKVMRKIIPHYFKNKMLDRTGNSSSGVVGNF